MSCLDVIYQQPLRGLHQYRYSLYQRPRLQKFGRYKMQDAFVESRAIGTAVDYTAFQSQTFIHPVQTYTPNTHPNYSPSTYSLTSLGTQFLAQHADELTSGQDTAEVHTLHENDETIDVLSDSQQNGIEDEEEILPEVEYVNARCMFYTYYTGDVNKIVDSHFEKSLCSPTSFKADGLDWKKPQVFSMTGTTDKEKLTSDDSDGYSEERNDAGLSPLMCRRIFPPSFWISSYLPNKSPAYNPQNAATINYINDTGNPYFYQTTLNSNNSLVPVGQTDSFISADSFTSFHHHRTTGLQSQVGDPWHFAFVSPTTMNQHKPALGFHELSYGITPSSAFNPRYSSLLIQPSVRPVRLPTVPGQVDLPKPSIGLDQWTNFQSMHSQQHGADLMGYSIEAGTTTDPQFDATKEIYWF